jgi:hypothetical protein
MLGCKLQASSYKSGACLVGVARWNKRQLHQQTTAKCLNWDLMIK